ncbi:hypothetical protein [Vibrio metschnikovii]|uniref:hypothetical protein n=1 Tax=Vibrio metschnikovii TaxID=28172 RepID=UPI002FC78562
MSNEKNTDSSNRPQNDKSTPVRDTHESGTALNRQCPTGGSNKSNNISQSQMPIAYIELLQCSLVKATLTQNDKLAYFQQSLVPIKSQIS